MSEQKAESRKERREVARSRAILDVANELHMELFRSGRDYRWKEHDSLVISPDNNLWQWFSRNVGGDVISLVETIKEVDFNQAVDFLNDGDFKTFQRVERKEEPFNYYLKPYEQPFREARNYLKHQRKLSDETIDFFLDQGVLAQANAKINGSIEPVLVFKSLTQEGEIIGAQLQGIEANWDKWPERGYAKKIMNNSDGMTGLHVDIGQPNRLIFTESAIDLMSYYELHKDKLQDARLVSIDGLKESIIGRHLVELEAERSRRPLRWSREELSRGLATAIDKGYFTESKNADMITLAVDNDTGGRNFISSLQEKGVRLRIDIPDLPEGQEKADWNSYLQQEKQTALGAEISPVATIQERLSTEADFVSTIASDGSIIYTKTVSLNEEYHLNLAVHSPDEVDHLSEVKAPWTLEVIKDSQSLGYLAYGEDWGNEFNIEDELVNLDYWLTRNQVANHLYSQEEVNHFLALLTAEKEVESNLEISESKNDQLALFDNLADLTPLEDEEKTTPENSQTEEAELISYGSFIIDDEFLESRYSSVEHDNSIRTAIGQLSNLIGFDNMPTNDQETEWVHTKTVDFEGNQLVLDVYSSSEALVLENGKNSWSIAVLGKKEPLGFLAYGEDWLNEQATLKEKLADLQTWITEGSVKKHLSTQQDYNKFLGMKNKKSLEKTQEIIEDRASVGEGYLQPEADGSAKPVVETTTFEQTVTSHPTSPYRYLHFSTNFEEVQRRQSKYHPIEPDDLKRMNQYSPSIQRTAQWYLDELSGSHIHYFYSDHGEMNILDVSFKQENFLHLTGIRPVVSGKQAADFVVDFATGYGNYNQILVSNNLKDKLQVLPMLEDIIDPKSFVLDNLDEVRTAKRLNLSEAIKSKDEDFLLLFKDIGEERVPASLMKIKGDIKADLSKTDEKIILGVIIEKDSKVNIHRVNEDYVKDGGFEMKSIVENKQFEEVKEAKIEVTAEDFTHVLDAVYNNGAQVGKDNRDNIPEALYPAWDKYYTYAETYDGDFRKIMEIAEREQLLDKTSDFYKAWTQDDIYDNHYHVRLQELSAEASLPFNVTEFIDYQTFVKELYQRNQKSQSGDEVTSATVNFAIYAPGGDLVKEEVSYHIGEESKPISQLLGLGYRRLAGYQELAQLDKEALSQLENQVLNQSIAKEANEPMVTNPEQSSEVSSKEHVETRSEKELLKQQFKQRVEEILSDSPAQTETTSHPTASHRYSRERSNAIKTSDYGTITPYELSQVALQKIREYTQSPEDLQEYLTFMSRFPHLSPRNVALIQAQWPGANAVATYKQWQAMGDTLGLSEEDVMQTKATYMNKRTGNTKEVVHQGLSVKVGEKSQITLFRPQMEKMIPVLDSDGHQVKNEKGNPKFKRLSQATPQEKALVKEKQLSVTLFQKRDAKGQPLYTTYKVFELSQTTLKPESYPKAMPNRHYNFDIDQVKTYEVLEGLCDYAKSIGVTILSDDAHKLGNIKGSFNANRQEIVINTDNTPGEQIATTIHELAHASLHNPKLQKLSQPLPRHQAELEAEMTSYLVSNHFGLDTGTKAIRYMAKWTNNLNALDDNALADSMKRIHKTVMSMVNHVEQQMKPYQRTRGQEFNMSKDQGKGMKR